MRPTRRAALAAFAATAATGTPERGGFHDIPFDLVVPEAGDGKPGAGLRVRESLSGYESWDLRHVLYLPRGWKPGGRHPVIVEYPGNGPYKNALGDVSTGRVEDCRLGFGMGGGNDFIWVCLPFVDKGGKRHARQWWGDPDATATYCRQAVARVCGEFGGDPERVVLCGFSRGAIACGYIGLRDDATARLWRGIFAHSHYDGVRRWGYADDSPEAAMARLRRLNGRPQFVSHEESVEPARAFLKKAGAANTTFLALPWPNHTADWVLKDIPERRKLREWLGMTLTPAR